jgi:hypothetical protein
MLHIPAAIIVCAGALGATPASPGAMSAPARCTPTRVGAADSTVDPALTAKQLTTYIAVKQALATYWQDAAHAALLQTAKSTGHSQTISLGAQQLPVGVFDYPALVQQDSALGALFTQHHFAPAQFEPIQVAVFHALGVLTLAKAGSGALPASTTVLGQNIALVQAQQQALAAVGVVLRRGNGGGGGINGGQGGGPLNLAATQAKDQARTQQLNQFVASRGPLQSPRDTARATIGTAHVVIDYGRPSKRGRDIFGGLVPYGQVWRTGANAATVLQTDQPLWIDTLKVPAGTYTLYTLPSATGWQLIVNKEVGQWGLVYHPEFDLGRVPMTVATTTASPAVEKFLIKVGKGWLRLRWDTTVVQVPLATSH